MSPSNFKFELKSVRIIYIHLVVDKDVINFRKSKVFQKWPIKCKRWKTITRLLQF